MADFFLTFQRGFDPLDHSDTKKNQLLKEFAREANITDARNSGRFEKKSSMLTVSDDSIQWTEGFKKGLELIKSDIVEAQQQVDDKESLDVIAALIEKVTELQKTALSYAPTQIQFK